MSIKKRGEIWWVDITAPDCERIRRSTGTKVKREAQEYHDKLRAELWASAKLGKSPTIYFEQAVVEFLKDGKEDKTFHIKQMHARYWLNIFSGRDIKSLTGLEISESLPELNVNTKKPVSCATKNRYRASMSRILNLAYRNDWLDKVPYIQSYKEPKVRIRWITEEQAQALISSLSLEWMKNVSTFALLTGARMSEVLTLEWCDVVLKKEHVIITAEKSKSGRARALPLNHRAMDLLTSLKRDSKYVFTRRTLKRIKDIDRRAFEKACKKAEIVDFTFHDLRHTWATWHVQSGTPLFTLKEMGGWETLEMVKKYAHLDTSHLSAFSDRVTLKAQSLL